MTTKEYLSQVYNLDHKIYLMKLEVQEYRRLASSIPGVNYDKEVVSGTRNLDAPFVKWIYKALDKEQEIKVAIKELEQKKIEVLNVIDEVENADYRMLLKYRYLNIMNFPDIAQKLYV